MLSSIKSAPGRLLLWLAHSIYRHRRLYFYPQAILFLGCILYTVKHLEFETDRSALVGGGEEYHQVYLEYKKEFPREDDLVVLVESESTEKNRQFVERLGAKLEQATNEFQGVFYKGDLKMMGRKALLFLPENDLKEMRETLRNYEPFLQKFTQATNLVSLFNLINRQVRAASRDDPAGRDPLLKALPALERIVTQATDGLNRAGMPPSPGITALFGGGPEAEQHIYLTFTNRHRSSTYLVNAQPRTRSARARALERMRELIAETQQEVPGLNVGLTGEYVLEFDEMQQSQADSTLATLVSLVIVALIFIYGYHETGRPLKATACLLVGLAYTMGYATLVVGHLNILTITFVPILVGLAIDFGVHLITRYEEELRHGQPEIVALEKAMVNTGLGIFTGALTTAGAFFAMGFTEFQGIKEMGIICGGGLIVCLIPMITLLPLLLLRGRQNVLDHQLGPILESQAALEVDRRARLESLWLRRPVTTVCVIGALTAVAAASARWVEFDYNLLHMQSAGLPAVVYQDKLIACSTKSVLFGAVVASNAVEAVARANAITNLSTVADIDTMARYLTDDVTAKLALIRQVTETAARVRFGVVDTNPVQVADLKVALNGFVGYFGLILKELPSDEVKLKAEIERLHTAARGLFNKVLVEDAALVASKLGGYQQALFADVRETFETIRTQDTTGGLRAEDLPETLRHRFIGVTGAHLIQVYPKEDIWNRAAQEKFVRQLQTVDRNVTGTPVELLEYTTLLKNSYEESAIYSLIAIALLVFVHFRSLACVGLALIPVGTGFLWMVGLMGVFHIPFNPANIMTLPLIVGIGVTNGIHILNRFAEEQHPSILARSTGKAVLVSGLTTIAGFGSLILAQHRGIRSLGFIMAVGVATCLVVALTLLPALLNLLDRYGWTIKTIKKTQRDNAQSTLGREEPR